jgi:archaetidylinositol phosphate synthase
MSRHSFVDAPREQNGILAGVEARILRSMAARMPDRINSDHLTALGFLAMLAAAGAYALSRENKLFLHLVNVCLVLNWMGDSLDGTLARYRNRLRPRYGFYVDHILDTISMAILVAGMALSDCMSFGVASLVLIVYLMLCINVYLATYTIGTFKISFGRFSPTELRLLLAVGNLVLLFQPTVRLLGNSYRLFDVGGTVAVTLMTGILIATTVQNIQLLYNAERLR